MSGDAQCDLADSLAEGLARLGIETSGAKLAKVAEYASLLDRWNKTYNLTSVREIARFVPLHLLDSLAVLPYLDSGALLDVGSGAGLPGIPLAVMRPDLQVTLLDSNSKKSAFQQQAVIELGLGNVAVVCRRVEQYRPPAGFTQIVSRAFSDLNDFVGLTGNLLAPGGRWLAMKGLYPAEEIRVLPQEFVVDAVHRLLVPGVDGDRHLVVIKRV
jgi:16S rRNA (guanine527-N7)-methyltransferase